MFPKFLGNMVDLGNKGKMMEEISQTGLILLAILVTQAVFSYFRTRIFVFVTEKTLASIRQHVYNHLIKLPMAFFPNTGSGSLTAGSLPISPSFRIHLPVPWQTFSPSCLSLQEA
jgi:ABC-type multidrug transport system fused ATPase/permease subunit